MQRLSLVMFVMSLCALSFGYGIITMQAKIFPFELLQIAKSGFERIRDQTSDKLEWYYVQTDYDGPNVSVHIPGKASPGLRLISGLGPNKLLFARVLDEEGETIHEWQFDGAQMWPDATHIPADMVPKERPGTLIHGIMVLDNGDLAFNLERLGLFRQNACGNTVWRLPYMTHHSLHRDATSGNFWVSGQIQNLTPDPRFPSYQPPFDEYTVLEVSPSGQILREFSIPELLHENALDGYLYMMAKENDNVNTEGDTLHLNDVETFPDDLQEGIFKHGDVMVSLRNIHTVLVFDPDTRKIRFIKTGDFVRQHDPDFIDGNTITVFDNNNVGRTDDHSRIVRLFATGEPTEIIFEGSEEHPFFTDIMGKHQWLQNGNLLITESTKGRAFEVSPDGEIVWEYRNLIGPGILAFIDEAQVLPAHITRETFRQNLSACGDEQSSN